MVRAEKIPDPAQYIQAILDRVEPKNIYDTYGISEWADSEDFLKKLSVKTGKLLRGGEPDYNNVARQIIVDYQRGNIPYFERPPMTEEEEQLENERIVAMDPAVKNPIDEVAEEQNLSEAQNALLNLVKNTESDKGRLIN